MGKRRGGRQRPTMSGATVALVEEKWDMESAQVWESEYEGVRGEGGCRELRGGGAALTQGRSWQQSNKEVPSLEAPFSAAFPQQLYSEH